MTTVQISFIVPLYNCLPLTQAMLASLEATLPPGLSYEVIFVDDGSTDGTREWLAGLTSDRYRVLLNERNRGYAAANNRAAGTARGEFLALLNNDLVLLPHWLEPMLAAHARLGDRAGLIGNVQLDAKSGAIDHAGLVINLTGKPVHLRSVPTAFARFFRSLVIVPAVTGACMLVQRKLWETLGGFDAGYVNGGEDIDLCFRARAAGRVNAVALRSVVKHHVSSSPGRKDRDEQNSYRLALRWCPELIGAADDGARAWCREYLARALVVPHSAEFATAIAASGFLARIRSTPPSEAVVAIEEGMRHELARWEKMFAG